MSDEDTFDNFREAYVDGIFIHPDRYTTAPGSLIITLKEDYLDTLSVGDHVLTVVFTDGQVDIPFTVTENITPKPVDPTRYADVAVPSDTFTFRTVWDGGSEKSIDFTLYKADGSVYHHAFDKKVTDKNHWEYSASFSEPAACYVIVKPVEDYTTRYENVGVYAQVTDRCCDGGTVVCYKIPKTGDDAHPFLWLGCILAGLAVITVSVWTGKRKKAQSK